MAFKKYGDRKEMMEMNMTQIQVADKLFINPKTVSVIEKRAMEKVRAILANRKINVKDLLGD
jgi:DNA-binding CsgD family transcriptional regulator